MPAKSKFPDDENLRTGDPFSESIFTTGIAVREKTSFIRFTPNLSSYIEILRSSFQQLRTDDVQLTKKILPECFDYYNVFCLWARIVHIKSKNQLSLTNEEDWLMEITSNKNYSVLEPVSIFLRGIGNITTKTGQHPFPDFPSLPTESVAHKNGFFGSITTDTHNLYKEIPCLGVLADAIQNSISNIIEPTYQSVLSTAELSVNSNLLGYKNLLSRTCNVTTTAFYVTKIGTAINIGLINAISDSVATFVTFKTISTRFSDMTII